MPAGGTRGRSPGAGWCEVHEQRTRVAQDHDKAIERAALPLVEDRAKVTPIDLTLFPWGGLEADAELAQALALLAQGPEKRAEDRTAARITLGLDLVIQPHRCELGTFYQAPFEVRFERIQLRGSRGGAVILWQALAPQGSPDRVAVNA
jgi:hypothetical protein